MHGVGPSPSKNHVSGAPLRQRLQVGLCALVMLAIAVFALLPDGTAPTTAAAAGIEAASTTTIYGPVFPLAQFPVQGKCSFVDSYGADRSGGRFHEGVDLIAKTGQYVYAATNGTLTKQYIDAPSSLSGNGWRLTMADGTYFFYAHFSAFAAGLSVGSKVVAGQIIGYVGMTGNAGTPHLHFEIHPGGGAAINPTPSVKAVDGCNVTTPPAVANNPSTPNQVAKPAVTSPPLAPAVRVSLTTTTTTPSSPPATTPPTVPTSTPPASTPPANEASGAGRWQFIEPVVVFNGTSASSLVAGVTTKVKVAGVTGIASATTGVLVRVSATVASAGSVVVHPCSGAAPAATTIFAEAGAMAIGATPVAVVNGEICVTSNTSASAKLTVVGQIAASGAGVSPIMTTRVIDSRISGRLNANDVVTVPQSTFGGAAAKAATVTVTILNPAAAGTLSIGPCGGTALKAPFANTSVAAFSAVVPVSAGGMCVSPSVAADIVLDADAVWRNDAPGIVPVKATRVYDSRDTGTQIWVSPTQVAIPALDGGPASTTAVNINLTVLGGPAGGSVFVWACGSPQPSAAVGSVGASKRASFSVISATPGGQLCVASTQPVDVLIDVSAVA